ncbi:MAG: hypothetical protein WC156_07540 [Pedobacter sp.]
MIEFPWSYLGTVISAFAGGLWAVYKFANEYRENRKWKQIEFLLNLSQKFFGTDDIKACIIKLDNTHELDNLRRIFESERAILTDAEIQELEKFRSLFQFFDNLNCCIEMKALTLDQINLFGWFLNRIGETDFIRVYCAKVGFSNVIALADKLEKYVYSSAYSRLHRV